MVMGLRDTLIIPDKYNTGCDDSRLADFNASDYPLVFRDNTEGDRVSLDFNAAKCLQNITETNSTIVFENVDFSKYLAFFFLNLANFTARTFPIKFVFRNCRFICVTANQSTSVSKESLSFEFINCTMFRFNGANNSTIKNCRIGGASYFRTLDGTLFDSFWVSTYAGDPLNPKSDTAIENSYIYDIMDNWSHQSSSGSAHVDGMQTQAIENVHIDNCRWEVPEMNFSKNQGGINVCLFLQGVATNSSITNCITNGGGYFQYSMASSDSLVIDNLKYGANYRTYPQSPFYNNVTPSSDVGYSETDLLYVSSVNKVNDSIRVVVSNDTRQGRTLRIKTNKGNTDFGIGRDWNTEEFSADTKTFADMPYDVVKTIDGSGVEYVSIFDVTDGTEHQIRYVEFGSGGSNVLIRTSTMASIADSIRTQLGSVDVYKPDQMAGKILSIPKGIMPAGNISIIENGEYDVTDYAQATVNIHSSAKSHIISTTQVTVSSAVTLTSVANLNKTYNLTRYYGFPAVPDGAHMVSIIPRGNSYKAGEVMGMYGCDRTVLANTRAKLFTMTYPLAFAFNYASVGGYTRSNSSGATTASSQEFPVAIMQNLSTDSINKICVGTPSVVEALNLNIGTLIISDAREILLVLRNAAATSYLNADTYDVIFSDYDMAFYKNGIYLE